MDRTEMKEQAEARKEHLRDAARAFVAKHAPADKVDEYTDRLLPGLEKFMAQMPWTDLMRWDDDRIIKSAGVQS